MTTALLFLLSSPSSSEKRSYIAEDHGHPDPDHFSATISKLTARKTGGKQPAPKRPPQRGLGIAQLERLRIQESQKLTDGEFWLPTCATSPYVYVNGVRWNDLQAPGHGLGVGPPDHPRLQQSFNQISDREFRLPSYAIPPPYTNVGCCGWHDLPTGSAAYGYQRWRTISHAMTPYVPASAVRSEFLDHCAVDQTLMTGVDTRFRGACPPIVEPPSNQMHLLGNCKFVPCKKRRLSGVVDQEFDTVNIGHVAAQEERPAPYYLFFPPIVRSVGDSEIANQTVDDASPSTSSPNLVDLSLKLG